MNPITLSICIPTFNRGNVLYNNLKHNININLEDVEFVISDNGSQDNTEKLIGTLKDKRIRYYNNKDNLGYDINILKLVERSNGAYLLILSDKDILNIKEIEKLVYYLRNNQNFTLLLGSIGKSTINNEYFKYYQNEQLYNEDRFLKILSDFTLFHYGYISGIVFKRSALNTDELYDYNTNFYMHYVLSIQALISGPVLCTSNIFCYLGQRYKNSKIYNVKSSHILIMSYAPGIAYMYNKRIQIIKKFITCNSTVNSLLNIQRDMFALRLASLLFSRNIKNFFIVLPYVIHIEELEIKKIDFWLKVSFYIPAILINILIKNIFSNIIPFKIKDTILKTLFMETC